jgi:shikimate dehydrogenase
LLDISEGFNPRSEENSSESLPSALADGEARASQPSPTFLPPSNLRALVLGTGGASAAVQHVLRQAGIGYQLVSRSGVGSLLSDVDNHISYQQLTPEIVDNCRLIVNTTPLGTWPDPESTPDLPYDGVGEGHFLYDLVYNPPQTAFLAEGLRRRAAILNGETMLHAQAEKAWTIWNSEGPQQ